ncbi:MAG: response regulator, partial [Alphaproteobacteria bacterium]
MAYDISRVRFLVVEDNPALSMLFRSLLTGLGVKDIATAANCEQAKGHIHSFKPDIVITDYKMAPMTGIDLTLWLRRNPLSPDPECAIIMTSAYSEAERVIAARDAGVNEFLVKPVTVHTLYQRIRAVIESNRSFVRAESYVGPCRRRGQSASFNRDFPCGIVPTRKAWLG